MDIGYFGDERLKKMARGCCDAFAIGRRFACANWATTGLRKLGSGAF
jgi:hypothetical protein